jgi:uncharacterized protein YbjT (DUF2867 family)
VVAIGRNPEKLMGLGEEQVQCDFDDPNLTLENSPIKTGDLMVLSAGVRFVTKILTLCPPDIKQLVVLGTARHLSAYPGDTGLAMRGAINILQAQTINWTLLAPTMIYGAAGENNVKRMAKLIRRFGVVPLPGGGKNMLQPIHTLDVVEAVVLAADNDEVSRKIIHISGPEAITNKTFLEEIAKAIGKPVKILALPKELMIALAFVTRFVPGVPTITGEEVERLLEDRSIDISEMKNNLGLHPRPLKEGLAETFGI